MPVSQPFSLTNIPINPPDTAQTLPQPPNRLRQRLQALQGKGQPLEKGARQSLEGGLSADLSRVHIHTDAEADTLAQSLQAEAFTTGPDIFFRAGRYAPSTSEGFHILAHEATHVVQQTVKKSPEISTGESLTISHPDDHAEQSAEATARQLTRTHQGASDRTGHLFQSRPGSFHSPTATPSSSPLLVQRMMTPRSLKVKAKTKEQEEQERKKRLKTTNPTNAPTTVPPTPAPTTPIPIVSTTPTPSIPITPTPIISTTPTPSIPTTPTPIVSTVPTPSVPIPPTPVVSPVPPTPHVVPPPVPAPPPIPAVLAGYTGKDILAHIYISKVSPGYYPDARDALADIAKTVKTSLTQHLDATGTPSEILASYPKALSQEEIEALASAFLGKKVSGTGIQGQNIALGGTKVHLTYRPPSVKVRSKDYEANLQIRVNDKNVLNYHIPAS